jgi:hypothetical protein
MLVACLLQLIKPVLFEPIHPQLSEEDPLFHVLHSFTHMSNRVLG